MKYNSLKTLVRYAMLIALTTVMTMVIQIPTVGTEGYLNLGDMVVFLAALILGRKGGFIVGGFGSALADLITGYTHYVPITFVVKGLEGFIAASLLETKIGKDKPIVATSIAGIFMAFGYFIPETFMYGKAAVASIPGNILQGLVGAITSVVLYNALNRVKGIK
ncbi:putative membrane protein [Keratinibaculum paraultunense]|uniref:Putative membrane protein n=1 Tax=Keratinibaculum paraultunense TaxID=1278232 RepID=A0A4R3KRF7_9FIRM|nr:ECF transporter S component [Keratinibaculum paraultunense]QQY79555.1 ECF transporter S component [Keratinibaculum paraultunense]TCS87580.1 putative membrane protein [Keratinibaculum paraultunense]